MRPRRRLALALLCALLACSLTTAGAELAPPAMAKKYTKKQKRVIRAKLLKQLKKDPKLIRKRWFLRRASDSGFALPLTARMTPTIRTTATGPLTSAPANDTLEFDLGSGATTVPAGTYAGAVNVTVAGKFKLTGYFGRDTIGYGSLGVMELGAGTVDLTAESFPVVNANPLCGDGSPLLKTGPVDISEAPPVPTGDRRGGSLNWLTGNFSFRLWTQWAFNSLSQDVSCPGAFFWSNRVDGSGSIIPIDLVGKFNVSPAFTTDGKLRLFKVAAADSTTPQPSPFAQLHYCRDVTAFAETDPAPTDPCTDEGVVDGRTKILNFTYEVLIGDW